MADNTRMKSIENSITDMKQMLQKFLDDADRRYDEYSHHRHLDQVRFERVEAQISTLHLKQSADNKDPPSSSVAQPFQLRNIKLDFPRFDGSDVLNWIFKAEQFFDYYGTPDTQRLIIAAVHMEKDVVPWFQMVSRNQPFQSWSLFTRALELEFGPSPYESPRPTLFKLAQTSSVLDYYTSFTALAKRSQGLSPEATLDCFISGL